MGDFNIVATLLTIYLFIGLFGGSFGLTTSLTRDVLNLKPTETPSLTSSVFGFLGFVISIVILPFIIPLSDIHYSVVVIVEFISILTYLELVLYIRGRN